MSETAEFNDVEKMRLRQQLAPQEQIEPEVTVSYTHLTLPTSDLV